MRLALIVLVTSLVALGTAGVVPAFVGVPPGPNATSQCAHLSFCYGVDGPWVIVPARGEATFLIGCPERAAEAGAYLLGGTDACVQFSKHVHVSYEGKLGAPIGVQTTQSSTAGLLFHASTDNGKPGSFQPVLGCINLKQASKRSTLAARAAPPPVGACGQEPAAAEVPDAERRTEAGLEPHDHRQLPAERDARRELERPLVRHRRPADRAAARRGNHAERDGPPHSLGRRPHFGVRALSDPNSGRCDVRALSTTVIPGGA